MKKGMSWGKCWGEEKNMVGVFGNCLKEWMNEWIDGLLDSYQPMV